jgi:DNA-binding Xre family transcriptional regulator
MIVYRLKEIAAAKEWTKTKLHYVSGVSYPTISRIWDGEGKNPIKQIDMDVLDALCAALDCEPGDLIKRMQP